MTTWMTLKRTTTRDISSREDRSSLTHNIPRVSQVSRNPPMVSAVRLIELVRTERAIRLNRSSRVRDLQRVGGDILDKLLSRQPWREKTQMRVSLVLGQVDQMSKWPFKICKRRSKLETSWIKLRSISASRKRK